MKDAGEGNYALISLALSGPRSWERTGFFASPFEQESLVFKRKKQRWLFRNVDSKDFPQRGDEEMQIGWQMRSGRRSISSLIRPR